MKDRAVVVLLIATTANSASLIKAQLKGAFPSVLFIIVLSPDELKVKAKWLKPDFLLIQAEVNAAAFLKILKNAGTNLSPIVLPKGQTDFSSLRARLVANYKQSGSQRKQWANLLSKKLEDQKIRALRNAQK